MKKRKLVLSLLLLIVQAFFVVLPVFAADEAGGKKLVEKTVSFAETTIADDMEDKVADLVKIFGVVEQKVSLISFAAERTEEKSTNFNLYFYVYVPNSSVSRFNTAKVSISKTKDVSLLVYDLKQIDRSNKVYKFAAMNIAGSDIGYDNKENLSFYVHNFSLNGASYPAVGYGLPYGEAEAGLSLSFDVDQSEAILKSSSDDGQTKKYTIKAPKALKDDTLTLNTTLVSERVTTKDANCYLQVNTALITIPNEYFDEYGKLSKVEYMYNLWKDVAMIVTTSKSIKDAANKRSFDYVGTIDALDSPLLEKTILAVPEFVFLVDSINDTAGAPYDVTSEEILKAFQEFLSLPANNVSKETVDNNLQTVCTLQGYYLAKNRLEDVRTSVKASDVIKSESYASANDWWDKFLDGKLFRLNVDDSVTLPGISVFDYADLSKTDADLSKKYCIDANEIPKLRALTSLSSSHQVCLVRYLTTEYNVYPGGKNSHFGVSDGRKLGDSYIVSGRGDGYFCQNAIIENFKIVQLFFEKTNYVLGRINRTTIMVNDKEQDYAGGTESGGKLEDEKTDPSLFLPWNWGRQDDKLSIIWKAIRIVVIALVVFILIRLFLRLIPPLRKALQKSPPDDKPERKDKS